MNIFYANSFFRPLINNFYIVEEVSVQNCEQWFPLIRLHATIMSESLSDSEDYFCMLAVKNSISEYKNNVNMDAAGSGSNAESINKEQWNLQPINNAFLQSV